jgi:hypothetical protein
MTMTIRQSIERLLNRRGLPKDPDEYIEIGLVPLGSGPMTVETLRAEGFDATGDQTYNIVTEVGSDFRILVPRRQAAAATARLDDLL